jgi:hypothetical protein
LNRLATRDFSRRRGNDVGARGFNPAKTYHQIIHRYKWWWHPPRPPGQFFCSIGCPALTIFESNRAGFSVIGYAT